MRIWAGAIGLLVLAGYLYAQEGEKPKPKGDKGKIELDDKAEPLTVIKKAPNQKEMMEKVSYGIGANVGSSLKQQGMKVDLTVLIQGLQDGFAGKQLKYTDEELQAAFAALQREMQSQAIAKAKELAQKNRTEGEDFLAANKEKPGIKTLASGLQYKVLEGGKGGSPKPADTVRVHYRGKLIDGKVFDESYKGEKPAAGEKPAEFPVNGVIKGWTEALQKMKVGDRWQLFIPSELAYGEQGPRGSEIGPNAVLVFEVTLLEIVE